MSKIPDNMFENFSNEALNDIIFLYTAIEKELTKKLLKFLVLVKTDNNASHKLPNTTELKEKLQLVQQYLPAACREKTERNDNLIARMDEAKKPHPPNIYIELLSAGIIIGFGSGATEFLEYFPVSLPTSDIKLITEMIKNQVLDALSQNTPVVPVKDKSNNEFFYHWGDTIITSDMLMSGDITNYKPLTSLCELIEIEKTAKNYAPTSKSISRKMKGPM